MAILSKRLMAEVSRVCQQEHGMRPCFVDLSGQGLNPADALCSLPGMKGRRNYALQESVNRGEPYVFEPLPGVAAWITGLEDRRVIHGGMMSVEAVTRADPGSRQEAVRCLVSQGMEEPEAAAFVARAPCMTEAALRDVADKAQLLFYRISGWQPELMKENRLRALQQEQINQAIQDQKRAGQHPLYAFEKERALLANMRAGDRSGARRLLNEMLASIYLSTSNLVVLRARAIELMSCLTRAAIEDNPLMEPLIEKNHAWTDRLIQAPSFEQVSQELMNALDDFIDGVYLHGVNRSNTKVRKALDYISAHFMGRIGLEAVAREVGLSASRLSHLVKQFTGRTVLEVIQEVRIRHAQHLLERTDKSCTEIAYEVGFGDQSYFIKHFKRMSGTTPGQYRRSLYGDHGAGRRAEDRGRQPELQPLART